MQLHNIENPLFKWKVPLSRRPNLGFWMHNEVPLIFYYKAKQELLQNTDVIPGGLETLYPWTASDRPQNKYRLAGQTNII